MNRQERQELKAKMPRTVLDVRHTENCRVLPTREELLYRIASGGIAAEVGVAFGDFTASILENNRPEQLHLIDAWEGERFGSGLDKIKSKFAKQLDEKKLKISRGYSNKVLSEYADDYFDWVYIDTNHSFGTTWTKLKICHEKVKKHGRIAGHDFCTGNVVTPVPYGVVEACNHFCVKFGWQYEYITLDSDGHFSFCLMRM